MSKRSRMSFWEFLDTNPHATLGLILVMMTVLSFLHELLKTLN